MPARRQPSALAQAKLSAAGLVTTAMGPKNYVVTQYKGHTLHWQQMADGACVLGGNPLSGITIVFSTGLTGHPGLCHALMATFAQLGFKVIAFPLPDTHGSPHVALNKNAIVAQRVEILRQLAPHDRFMFLGNSGGGAMTIALAAALAEKTIFAGVFNSVGVPDGRPFADTTKRFLNSPGALETEERLSYWQELRSPATFFTGGASALQVGLFCHSVDVRDEAAYLGELHVPVKVDIGEFDFVSTIEMGEELAALSHAVIKNIWARRGHDVLNNYTDREVSMHNALILRHVMEQAKMLEHESMLTAEVRSWQTTDWVNFDHTLRNAALVNAAFAELPAPDRAVIDVTSGATHGSRELSGALLV